MAKLETRFEAVIKADSKKLAYAHRKLLNEMYGQNLCKVREVAT